MVYESKWPLVIFALLSCVTLTGLLVVQQLWRGGEEVLSLPPPSPLSPSLPLSNPCSQDYLRVCQWDCATVVKWKWQFFCLFIQLKGINRAGFLSSQCPFCMSCPPFPSHCQPLTSSPPLLTLKEALWSFGGDVQTPNFSIYNINELILQTHCCFLVNKQAVPR